MTQFTITELGNGHLSLGTSRPQIFGTKVIWLSGDNKESKIMLYDGSETVEIKNTNGAFPKISGDNLVWSAVDLEGDQEIYFYNGKETIQLTDNDVDDVSPQISGDNVVWNGDAFYAFRNVYINKIFLDNGQDTIQLNNDSRWNRSPVISGNKVAWSGIDSHGDRQVFFFDGKETIKIPTEKHSNLFHSQSGDSIVWNIDSDNNSNIEMVVNKNTTVKLASLPCFSGNNDPTCDPDIKDNYSPQISGDNVVWENDGNLFLYNGKKTIRLDDFGKDVRGFSVQISGDKVLWVGGISEPDLFLYDGKKTIQLSDIGVKALSPQLDGEHVVWKGIDAEGDSEIFFYNGKKTIQLTDNDTNDGSPQISGDNTIWQSGDGFTSEILLHNGSKTIQLTKNNELSEVSPTVDINPIIEGNRIVLERANMIDSTTKIMLLTLDSTESSSISTSDRNYKIITSSTIIILGLVSLCWFRKLFLQ